MISDKMYEELNEQIREETYSAYLYMAMSSYCAAMGLEGAAQWFVVQTREELEHALKFYGYLNAQQRHAVLKAIAKPPAKFESLLAMFEASLAHERHITGRIASLVNLALAEKDHATAAFLQWFVNEQVEEEDSVQRVLTKLGMAGDQKGPLFMIDRELGARGRK